ncbi:hypothetical protein [uncultured Brachyspira sp.]|nr:hypothetical protein [uncultured Brachyspira sp.]
MVNYSSTKEISTEITKNDGTWDYPYIGLISFEYTKTTDSYEY